MEIKKSSSQHICPQKGEILNPFKTEGKKKLSQAKEKPAGKAWQNNPETACLVSAQISLAS